MITWFWYACGAAILYGLHQVFTKLAADQIGEAWVVLWSKQRLLSALESIWGGFGYWVRGIRR